MNNDEYILINELDIYYPYHVYGLQFAQKIESATVRTYSECEDICKSGNPYCHLQYVSLHIPKIKFKILKLNSHMRKQKLEKLNKI